MSIRACNDNQSSMPPRAVDHPGNSHSSSRFAGLVLLLAVVLLAGCGKEATEENDDPASKFGRGIRTPKPSGESEPERLIRELGSTLAQLQDKEPKILNTLKKYRVELARLTANLRSAIARNGMTLDEIRLSTSEATLLIRDDDRRCSTLRVYITQLNSARTQVRILILRNKRVKGDLEDAQRVSELIDDDLLARVRKVLKEAGDQTINPEDILDHPELVPALAEAAKQTADAVNNSILPERAEKKLEDLPELPALDFTAQGQVEEFLLADLKDHMSAGTTAAETHLAAGRPEAAIESLHAAIQDVRKALAAFTQPLMWQADCLKELDTAQNALSEQLAGPYLKAVAEAIPKSRKSGDWSGVLDLLEAVVRLAPKAKQLPEAIKTLGQILDYRRNTEDFDAVVAWERLQEIKALLSGTTYQPVTFRPQSGKNARAITVDNVTLTFVWIPPGEFTMGTPASEAGHQTNEDQVQVTLTQGYWMLQTEVTQGMYNAFVSSRPWQGKEYVKSGSNYPAVYVSANEAGEWCRKATTEARSQSLINQNETIRLPTEAQWEYAARASTATAYFFGDDAKQLGDFAWFYDNALDIGEKYAHEVGKKQLNPRGLYDLSGNVWEWCADGYQAKLPGGNYPRVSSTGSSRVCRGGSFDGNASNCRVGGRSHLDAAFSGLGFFGFRVVLLVE